MSAFHPKQTLLPLPQISDELRDSAYASECVLRRVAGADAVAELEWRQGTPGSHQQDGRQVSSQALDRRHDLPRPARQVQARERRPLARLLARKPARVATVAMANKAARIAWAIMVRGDTYRAPTARLLAA